MAVYFVDDETPQATTNPLEFTLLHAPGPAQSLKLKVNGVRRTQPGDYTVSGNLIVFAGYTPARTDTLIAFYRVIG